MVPAKDTIEIIVPVFNEEACLDELVRRLLALKDRMADVDARVVFVNDG